MADIYRIQYDDVAGNAIQIDIADAAGATAIVEAARGYATLKRPQIDTPFQTIRETECQIVLEASTTQPFTDLFTETDRQWIVRLYRAGAIKFEGFLDPSDVFEDFVNSEWELELTAYCGLGELENIAYDDAGAIYEGKEGIGIILSNVLSKLGFTSRDLYFQNRSFTVDKFPIQPFTDPTTTDDWFNLTIEQGAFTTAGQNEPISCQEVLDNILGPVNACIFHMNGAWYINYVPHHADTVVAGVFWYAKYTGGVGAPVDEQRLVSQTIWSQVNGGPPFWVTRTRRADSSQALRFPGLTTDT